MQTTHIRRRVPNAAVARLAPVCVDDHRSVVHVGLLVARKRHDSESQEAARDPEGFPAVRLALGHPADLVVPTIRCMTGDASQDVVLTVMKGTNRQASLTIVGGEGYHLQAIGTKHQAGVAGDAVQQVFMTGRAVDHRYLAFCDLVHRKGDAVEGFRNDAKWSALVAVVLSATRTFHDRPPDFVPTEQGTVVDCCTHEEEIVVDTPTLCLFCAPTSTFFFIYFFFSRCPAIVKSSAAGSELLSADLVRKLPIARRTQPTVWKMVDTNGVKPSVARKFLLSADLVRKLPVARRTRPTIW